MFIKSSIEREKNIRISVGFGLFFRLYASILLPTLHLPLLIEIYPPESIFAFFLVIDFKDLFSIS